MRKENSDSGKVIQKLGILIGILRNSEQEHKESILKLLKDHGSSPGDFENLSVSDLHVIESIGSSSYPNVTFIAQDTGLTKSAVTKISTKLRDRNLIVTHRKENNKKEVLYSLTEKGVIAFTIHQQFHRLKDKKLLKLLERYRPGEIELIIKFLDDLIQTQ